MRKTKFVKGNIYHIFNRGVEKRDIFLNDADRWRFLQGLYLFNDENVSANTLWEISRNEGTVKFPLVVNSVNRKGRRNRLVKIMADCLMPNHYHLLLEENREGGISRFMHKLGTGMTNYFNIKHNLDGRLFRGAFKLKRIDIDEYLTYLSVYIQVKNLFERYPGGLKKATAEFDKAFDWGLKDPYCSLADYAGHRNSPIIEKSVLGKMFFSPEEYRDFAKQCILGMNLDLKIGKLGID